MYTDKELREFVKEIEDYGKRYVESLNSDEFLQILLQNMQALVQHQGHSIDDTKVTYRSRKISWDVNGDRRVLGNFLLQPVTGYLTISNGLMLHTFCCPNMDGEITTNYFLSVENSDEGKAKLLQFKKDLDSWKIDQLRGVKNRIIELTSALVSRLVEISPTAWDDVFIPEKQKSAIQASVDGFFKSKDVYKALGINWQRGVLLMGPPGNGKTMVCRAIASNSNMPFIMAKLDARTSDYEIEEAFSLARKLSPAIVCLEDVDRLFSGASGKSSLANFLNLLDGIVNSNEGVLVLGTANHPEDLDPALINRPSRFDRTFKFDLPSEEFRLKYLKQLTSKFNFSQEAIELVAEGSKGMSMAFLKEIVTQTALEAAWQNKGIPTDANLRDALKATTEHLKGAKTKFVQEARAGFGEEAEDFDD